jgi:hypothetical protein
MITGVLLFSRRTFSIGVAWSLIVLAALWLFYDLLEIRDTYSSLLESLNMQLIISYLKIIVPIGLLLSGLFILFKKTDRTIPACLLFAGSFVWILSMLLQITQTPVEIDNISHFLAFWNRIIVITVPVALVIFARTLLSKEKLVEPVSKQAQTETKIKLSANQLPEPIKQAETYRTSERIGQPDPGQIIKPSPVRKQPVIKPNPIQKQPVIKENPVHKQPVINENYRNVVFLREDRDNTNIWVVYKAPSKVEAMAFLSKQAIDRPSFFIVVETPQGNFGRDKDGIYQE